jgi:hypothetical protein
MFIIDDNEDFITKHIWKTSESVKDLSCKFGGFDKDSLSLDPGGIYCERIPHKEFEIDGYKFDVQLSRIEKVLYYMNMGLERIPGYIRFRMWRWLVIMPVDIFEKVKKYLEVMEKSDDAMHAELTEKEIKDSLYSDGIVIKRPEEKG